MDTPLAVAALELTLSPCGHHTTTHMHATAAQPSHAGRGKQCGPGVMPLDSSKQCDSVLPPLSYLTPLIVLNVGVFVKMLISENFFLTTGLDYCHALLSAPAY